MALDDFEDVWINFLSGAFNLEQLQSLYLLGHYTRAPIMNPLAKICFEKLDLSTTNLQLSQPKDTNDKQIKQKILKTFFDNLQPERNGVLYFIDPIFRQDYDLSSEISPFKGIKNGTPCICFHQLISNEDLTILANIDLHEIKSYTDKLIRRLQRGKKIRLQTKLGTDLTFTPRDWKWTPLSPKINGKVGFFPIGQVFTAPIEEETEGTVVVDRLISEFMVDWEDKIPFPSLKQPVSLVIEKGTIVEIKGGTAANFLEEKCLTRVTPSSRILGEVTFGTNPNAIRGRNIAIEDCARDTFHVGFGENRHLGGKNKANVHWDAVVEFDQKKIKILE
ncbi:MAG: hypothetical protein GF308_08745 [Candidatus Heimdallarchaeota archaeon]|nr:hypothetical protein [Candidatus Heimdallarchaeota archaeon]